MDQEITEFNYILLLAKSYHKPHFKDMDEFYEDVKRIKYIKKLLSRYKESGQLNERLVLNHLVVLYNIFDARILTEILVFKLLDGVHYLKPFLVFLGYWNDYISTVDGKEIHSDKQIEDILRKI